MPQIMTADAMADLQLVADLQLSEGEIRFYQEEGYLLIPGLISSQSAGVLAAEVLEVMAAAGQTYRDLCSATGIKGKLYQSGQYLEGSGLDAFINSPRLLSIAAQLMAGESSIYMPFSAVKSGGGGGTFHFHQDNQYTRFDGPGINLWTALSAMTPENGCLQIVPRSHLGGTIDAVSPDGDGHRAVAQNPALFLPIRMNPGDCVAFTRLTVHGSGPNNTGEPRLAYAVQYHRDDVSAIWDEQEPRLLKGSSRWNTRPAKALSQPDAKPRDGH